MALANLRRRLRTSDAERAANRLRSRLAACDAIAISDVTPRRVARVGGEVKRIGMAPRQGVPALEVVVSDGTGDVVAVFTGRRQIGGVSHGRLVVVEGMMRDERGRRVVLNPAYTLVAD